MECNPEHSGITDLNSFVNLIFFLKPKNLILANVSKNQEKIFLVKNSIFIYVKYINLSKNLRKKLLLLIFYKKVSKRILSQKKIFKK